MDTTHHGGAFPPGDGRPPEQSRATKIAVSVLIAGALGALILNFAAPFFQPGAGSFQNAALPELSPNGDGVWLNTSAPLTLAGLRGKVVFLQFSFLG